VVTLIKTVMLKAKGLLKGDADLVVTGLKYSVLCFRKNIFIEVINIRQLIYGFLAGN